MSSPHSIQAWLHLKLRACVLLATVAVFAAETVEAQSAPGAPVTILGVQTDFGSSGEVSGTFGRPVKAKDKMPAVLILHGSNGIDGRGAFYAPALQEAGIATLEIFMFPRGGRPQGSWATLPHAAAALRWLQAQPVIDGERLGVMGFSWGAGMSVRISSDMVREKLGAETPRPRALAAMYPVCHAIARPQPDGHPFHGLNDRMSATPILIQIGTNDDYEVQERPCDLLRPLWPKQAADLLVIRYIDGATHAFEGPSRSFSDRDAHGGRGGNVRVTANTKHAAEAREAVVRFFVEHLTP
jgi:dienelactone hydrolase